MSSLLEFYRRVWIGKKQVHAIGPGGCGQLEHRLEPAPCRRALATSRCGASGSCSPTCVPPFGSKSQRVAPSVLPASPSPSLSNILVWPVSIISKAEWRHSSFVAGRNYRSGRIRAYESSPREGPESRAKAVIPLRARAGFTTFSASSIADRAKASTCFCVALEVTPRARRSPPPTLGSGSPNSSDPKCYRDQAVLLAEAHGWSLPKHWRAPRNVA